MKFTVSRRLAVLWMICGGSIGAPAAAQQVQGSLIDLINSGRFDFNRLEQQAAFANQSVYNALAPLCDVQASPGACSVEQARLFGNVRELVETANELLGSGPTLYSLGLDEEGLGFSLRWTAAEELAAQSSAGSEFANNQLTSLMSRMTALRYGARGFSVVNAPAGARRDEIILAQQGRRSGGGASADDALLDEPRWGGFIDGSYGWGDRDPTEVEDAFDFDGMEVTVGVDYRVTPRFVLGAIVGRTQQEIDFDARRSVVDGGIESDGYSIIAYGLHEWNGPYLSASLGWQRLSLDTTRLIFYPSFNPDVESIDVTASGATHSTTVSATFNAGWALNWRAFGAEPYLRAEYRDMKLDGFQESSIENSGAATGRPAGFDFSFDDQVSKSLDTVLGIRVQYALTPRFGVLVPYFKFEYHRQLEDDPHTVNATYAGIGSAVPSAPFDLVGDEPDDSFQVVAAGFSLVLAGRWQGFIQYQTVRGMDLLSNDVITGGVRAEF